MFCFAMYASHDANMMMLVHVCAVKHQVLNLYLGSYIICNFDLAKLCLGSITFLDIYYMVAASLYVFTVCMVLQGSLIPNVTQTPSMIGNVFSEAFVSS